MLKIKDNVDLKELEIFGFKYYDHTGKYEYKNSGYVLIYINSWNREIYLQYLEDTLKQYIHPLDNIIFDLIRANLVEKGGGINESN